jgi:hypothetical protein
MNHTLPLIAVTATATVTIIALGVTGWVVWSWWRD